MTARLAPLVGLVVGLGVFFGGLLLAGGRFTLAQIGVGTGLVVVGVGAWAVWDRR